MSTPRLVTVDPTDHVRFAAWHDALRAGALHDRPPAPFFSLAEYLVLHTTTESRARRRRVALAALDEDGAVIGAAEVGLAQRWDTHTASVELAVRPEHRRRGTGTALHTRALELAESRSTLECEVDVPTATTLADWPGGAFALALGYRSANAEDRFLLALPAPLPAPTAPPGYALHTWIGACPPDRVDGCAALQTTMAADAPHGELEREERLITAQDVRAVERSLADRGYEILSTMAVGDDDEPAGYSEILVGAHAGEHVHQDDTLVARAHRGHGLGRAMKLANHAVLAQRHPARRWINTWTERDNTPMQRVNRSLGYRPVEVHHEVVLSR